MKHYIGITGFKTVEEIKESARAYEEFKVSENENIAAMYGFLIFDRQAKDIHISSKLNPSLATLPSLIKNVPVDAISMIHYCQHNSALNYEALVEILNYEDISSKLNALQLNNDWPDIKIIEKIKRNFPSTDLVLQLDPRTKDPLSAARMSRDYILAGVDRFLVDPSLGAGLEFDVDATLKYMQTIDNECSFLPNEKRPTYVVCGGLDGRYESYLKIKRVKELYKKPFSVDVEGRVRTIDYAALDKSKVEKYINMCARALI